MSCLGKRQRRGFRDGAIADDTNVAVAMHEAPHGRGSGTVHAAIIAFAGSVSACACVGANGEKPKICTILDPGAEMPAHAPSVPMKVTGVAASTASWRVWSSTRSRPCPANRHTMRPSFVDKNTTCDNKRQAYPENPGKVTAGPCIRVLICYNSPPWPGSSVGRAED